jgi:hypothetical protein
VNHRLSLVPAEEPKHSGLDSHKLPSASHGSSIKLLRSKKAYEHTKARAKRTTGGLGGWPPRKLDQLLHSKSAYEHTKARAKRATGGLGG